jgi:hypothetical protein
VHAAVLRLMLDQVMLDPVMDGSRMLCEHRALEARSRRTATNVVRVDRGTYF